MSDHHKAKRKSLKIGMVDIKTKFAARLKHLRIDMMQCLCHAGSFPKYFVSMTTRSVKIIT